MVGVPPHDLGVDVEFVQDNHSRSTRGVVRGMHFQIGSGQAKLVRCARGAIVDVVVDIRRESPTFGQWEAFELDDERLLLRATTAEQLRAELLPREEAAAAERSERASARTTQPSATSRRTSRPPMNPEPPVTKAALGDPVRAWP